MSAKDKTLHMVGNAHIDPVWLWQWDEGFQEVLATFRSALDRMDEFDEFVFTASSAAFYVWVEQNAPDMFAEIQRRVAEGRWQIVGGWWVEPDCNIPGGESFARHALYAQRYFKAKFSRIATVGYAPDSFGHHAMLPQLLSKSGLTSYVFLRPSPHEKGLPSSLFWWESDDGSRVLGFRIPYEYGAWPGDISKHVQRVASTIRPPVDGTLCFYGVGNHGGGPTIENLESLRRMAADDALPRLTYGGPETLLDPGAAAGWALPVVHDELQHHASGCYAAHSGIKRWNRHAEQLLMTAEKMAALAERVTGQPYPTDLALAWQNVLFNQFHDIMAGTSIEPAYDDARDLYGEASAIGGRALNAALQSLAWNIRIDPEPGMKPVVVFNPHAWPVRTPVELEYGGLREGDVLVDDDGHEVPMQTVQSLATSRGRYRLSWLAELPPMGYRVYRVRPGTEAPVVTEPAANPDPVLENERLRVEFNPLTGCIRSLRDKLVGTEVFFGEAAVPLVIDDQSDTWSHNVFRFDQVIGQFEPVAIRLVAGGPVKSVMRVTSAYGNSKLVQDFALYRDLNQVDVSVTVDWHEQHKALKLRFPLNQSHMQATYEIPYGHIHRVTSGVEEPGQGWVDVTGVSRDTQTVYGLSLLNDGKYSFDVNIRDIGLTVLRSPVYANHVPVVPDAGGHYSYIDQGRQHFTYSLVPHEGTWQDAGTARRAAELNQRPLALIGAYHPHGTLPQQDAFVSVDRDNIVVSVVKRAEDDDALVIRAYETAGVATEAMLCLGARVGLRDIRLRFGPSEIKTIRVPRDPATPVEETNLLEWAG